MQKPIYSSKQHEVIVAEYINLTFAFVEEISSKSKLNNYIDVYEILIEHHNQYGSTRYGGNWHDYLNIIPINLTLMTNGFFAGLETKSNASKVRSYKYLLSEKLELVMEDLGKLKVESE